MIHADVVQRLSIHEKGADEAVKPSDFFFSDLKALPGLRSYLFIFLLRIGCRISPFLQRTIALIPTTIANVGWLIVSGTLFGLIIRT
jgi:hypothetical protein